MIINDTDYNISLPFTPGDKVYTPFFSLNSVDPASFQVNSICITGTGDKIPHVRTYLKSDHPYIPNKNINVYMANDKFIVYGIAYLNEKDLTDQFRRWKQCDFTIPV